MAPSEQVRICRTCGETKTLNRKNWHVRKDGFQIHCSECTRARNNALSAKNRGLPTGAAVASATEFPRGSRWRFAGEDGAEVEYVVATLSLFNGVKVHGFVGSRCVMKAPSWMRANARRIGDV